MDTQTNTTNWLEVECATLNSPVGEKLPALKFQEENKIEEIEVDFSKPFNKYTDTDNTGKNVVKAIVPVIHNTERKIWWLNKKNPAYITIIKAGKENITKFKVMRVGSLSNTRYVFVK
jgi:hypothetical protein